MAKWLGVRRVRRLVSPLSGEPGPVFTDKTAFREIYGFNLEELSGNFYRVLPFRRPEDKLLAAFRALAAREPLTMFIETREKSGYRFIEKVVWRRCGDVVTLSIELVLVLCKYRRSCKRYTPPLWMKGGDYYIDGWPMLRPYGRVGEQVVSALVGLGVADFILGLDAFFMGV